MKCGAVLPAVPGCLLLAVIVCLAAFCRWRSLMALAFSLALPITSLSRDIVFLLETKCPYFLGKISLILGTKCPFSLAIKGGRAPNFARPSGVVKCQI